MQSDSPSAPPLTLAPRKRTEGRQYIIAFDERYVLVERTGELFSADQLPWVLVNEPPSLLVCERAAAVLAPQNTTICARLPGWQYRIAPVIRRTYKEHRRKVPTESHEVIVSFLGWRLTDRKTHYHYPLDPGVFSNQTIRRLVTSDEADTTLGALLEWGQDVRDWCAEQGLKPGSGAGALAVQLLKDERFYPEPRRKVPAATNEHARPHLPGNYYRLLVPERRYYNAFYVDMHAAHHTCASELQFPSSNVLLARGRFRDPPEAPDGKPWLAPGHPSFVSLLRSYGLLLVRLQVPYLAADRYPPPYMEKPGAHLAYIYTNELPLIHELGGRIEGIEAAWTSWHPDSGLTTFARWALAETAGMSERRKRWAKTTLLATYGMLASRPSARIYGYAQAVGGEEVVYMTAGGPLRALVKRQTRVTESPVVNVIQRGMIEAEVRLRTLSLARELHSFGCHVLCIYADSVIINSSGPVPLIPAPWRIKSELNRLQFFNPTSFHSDEMVRLPGIPEGIGRLSYAKMMAAHVGDGTRRGLHRSKASRKRARRRLRRMTRPDEKVPRKPIL